MLAQPITASQDLPLSPPVSVSEVCYSEKDMSAPMTNGMKLVSFADLLDEQLPSPPATFTQIIEAYKREGKGDVETLKAVLAAKQSEEDRIARILEIRITLLQMHAHRMGMVPVASSSTSPAASPISGHRAIHALPATRNRQRSVSPTSTSLMLPPMKLARAPSASFDMQARALAPAPIRMPSTSSVASISGVSERLGRPRELSSCSESERPQLPSFASIAGRKRAYTTRSEETGPTADPVYYQSRDKYLPSLSTSSNDLSRRERRLTLPTRNSDDGSSSKRLRTVDDSHFSDRQRCPNGLELLLNALERPDNKSA